MAKNTINLQQDTDYNILLNKSMDLNAVLTCQYYTGNTANDIVGFDFSPYSGATLVVKQNYRSDVPILSFDTIDGSLELSAIESKFKIIKTAQELENIQIGQFEYSMYLRSTTQKRRAFLSGKFIIESKIV